jgi:hypothetical protein
MPIRFRCSYCNRLLGIATRKAGTQTRCPHCGYEITVPVPQDDESKTERLSLDDAEQPMGRGSTEVLAEPAVAAPAPPSPPPVEQAEAQPGKTRPEPPHTGAGSPKNGSPAHPAAGKGRPAPQALPRSTAKPTHPEDPSLFEGDIDDILGASAAPVEPERPKPPVAAGMDALSLGEPARHIVISAQKATLFMVIVVVLMALAFAAGYFLAPKG